MQWGHREMVLIYCVVSTLTHHLMTYSRDSQDNSQPLTTLLTLAASFSPRPEEQRKKFTEALSSFFKRCYWTNSDWISINLRQVFFFFHSVNVSGWPVWEEHFMTFLISFDSFCCVLFLISLLFNIMIIAPMAHQRSYYWFYCIYYIIRRSARR